MLMVRHPYLFSLSLTLLADEIVECLNSLWAIICLQKKTINLDQYK